MCHSVTVFSVTLNTLILKCISFKESFRKVPLSMLPYELKIKYGIFHHTIHINSRQICVCTCIFFLCLLSPSCSLEFCPSIPLLKINMYFELSCYCFSGVIRVRKYTLIYSFVPLLLSLALHVLAPLLSTSGVLRES